MARFEGPFGVPTPERVFEEYEERRRKESIVHGNTTTCNISFGCDFNNYDIYEYIDEAIDDIKNQISSLEESNKKLKEENRKLNEKVNQIERSLRNVIVRI